MTARIFLFCLLVLSLTACTRRLGFQPAAVQPDGGDVVYTHGQSALRTRAGAAELSATLRPDGGRHLTIDLYLRNHGDSLVTFQPENVRVYGYNATGQRADFEVFTAEGYLRHRRNQQIIAGAVITAVAVGTAVAIAESNDRRAPDPDNHRDDDAWEDLWWFWAATPNIVVAATPPPAPPYRPSDGLLRRHTLYADESLQGSIKVRGPRGFRERLVVEVPVDGETVRLVFEPNRKKGQD